MAQVEFALNTADPVAPLSRLAVYAKSDKKLYSKDNMGVVNRLIFESELQTDYQRKNDVLNALAAAGIQAGRIPYYQDATTVSLVPLTSAGKNLIGATTEQQREFLGLVLGQTVQPYDAKTAKTNVSQEFTEKQAFKNGLDSAGDIREIPVIAAINGGYSLAVGSLFDLTVLDHTSLTFPAPLTGKQFTLILTQGGDGSSAITWPSNARFAGTTPTLTTGIGRTDSYTFLSIDQVWVCMGYVQNFSRT